METGLTGGLGPVFKQDLHQQTQNTNDALRTTSVTTTLTPCGRVYGALPSTTTAVVTPPQLIPPSQGN